MDLVDALIPEGIEIQRYLADHIPDAGDLRSVRALARSRRPTSPRPLLAGQYE